MTNEVKNCLTCSNYKGSHIECSKEKGCIVYGHDSKPTGELLHWVSKKEITKIWEELDERDKRLDERAAKLEEGTKFDKGKPRLGEMIMDFKKPLLEICKVWEFGADKYAKSNWKKVENGEDRYTNALARHFAAEMDEVVDAETKLHHAIHVAWNAIARLYFIIKDGE